VSRRSATDQASSVKLPALSAASFQSASLTSAADGHYSASDDAMLTKDLLRGLAEVNFIYGEVKEDSSSFTVYSAVFAVVIIAALYGV